MLKTLQRKKSFIPICSADFDIKILCNNKQFFAHRLVLASCSLWFNQIFKISESDDVFNTLSMHDFNPADIQDVLDFLYGRKDVVNDVLLKQLKFGVFCDIKKETQYSLTDKENIVSTVENNTESNKTQSKEIEIKDKDLEAENNFEDEYKENISPFQDQSCNEAEEMDIDFPLKLEVKENEIDERYEVESKDTIAIKIIKTKKINSKLKKSESKSCCMCSFNVDKKDAPQTLSLHYLQEHGVIVQNGKFKCDTCAKKFLSKQNLDIHVDVAHKGLKIKCDECSYECKNKSNLEKHKQKAHQGITFTCSQCNYIGSTKNKLREHVRVKHEGYKYMCDQCDHWTTDSSSLKHHKNSKHDNSTFPCSKCQYVGNTLKDLKKHTKIMHEPKKFLCDECDYAAAEMQTLTEHKAVKHEGLRLQCEFCDYSTKARSSLRDHRNVEHLGIKFLCDLCEYIGRNQSELKKHKAKRHEGLRFYCDLCDYSALAKATVKEHKKVKHEGLRFYCDECACTFICKENLKKHKKKRHDVENTNGLTINMIKTDVP
jgi:hypothetical protein